MSANSGNLQTCACTTQQYAPIIFNNVAYQNSANVIYNAKNATVIASTNGTLGAAGTGKPTFKSDYERMQFLLGKISIAPCGTGKKTFALS